MDFFNALCLLSGEVVSVLESFKVVEVTFSVQYSFTGSRIQDHYVHRGF